ncbi:hypothetical protein DL98DRAFT_320101 [Cadophora sp. DSE1049]|nr:hypothetical protein DL98DRAFT_320101 [Cadophora sp. DSE1049]
MNKSQRACDRCCSLKTQCNGKLPCGRCKRLDMACTNVRPFRPRGRPKKHMTTRDRAASEQQYSHPTPKSTPTPDLEPSSIVRENSAILTPQAVSTPEQRSPVPIVTIRTSNPQSRGENSPPIENEEFQPQNDNDDDFNTVFDGDDPEPLPTTAFGGPDHFNSYHEDGWWPDELSELGFNRLVASSILEHTLIKIPSWGFLSVVDHPELRRHLIIHDPSRWETDESQHPSELLCVVLAIGIELDPTSLPSHLAQSKELLIDILRINFLKYIPTLTWKTNDLTFPQCAALSLASYTWTLKEDLREVAGRWNDLAQLIHKGLRQKSGGCSLSDGMKSIGHLIDFQNSVLGLLHVARVAQVPTHKTRDATELKSLLQPGQTASESAVLSSTSVDEYIAIFAPLQNMLAQVSFGNHPSNGMPSVRNTLELYYLHYPRHLLEFSSLQYVYQAESMIWFHGIFMLTYLRQDLAYILLDEGLPSKAEFYSGFEHALLLGEVLPRLLALEPEALSLSSATVYFILLSSVVLSVALWQFHCQVGSENSTIIMPDAPSALLACATAHQQVLQAVSAHKSRYPIDLTQSVCSIISHLSTNGLLAEVDDALREVAHYRWCNGGMGIVRQDFGFENGQVQIWSTLLQAYVRSPTKLPSADGVISGSERRDAIKSLCSPVARICRPGSFDLSIQF